MATAHALLRRQAPRVVLFEAEPELARHSSSRSAGIWLPTEEIDEAPLWTRKSVELLASLFGDQSWISRTGAYKVAAERELLSAHFKAAQASGCQPAWLSVDRLAQELGWMEPEQRKAGFYVPEAGILDTAAILSRLREDALARGLELVLGTRVLSLGEGQRGGARWTLHGAAGELGRFDWVIDASGAWGSRLFEPLGYGQQLQVYRRHVLRWEKSPKGIAQEAIVWAESPEFYLRPDRQGQLWASPCDAQLVAPGCVELDPGAQTQLRSKLGRELPAASTVWSGTRTHTAQGKILKGPVPGAQGLAWLLGLAGRGMTVGLGVGDATAEAVLGS